MLSRMIAVVFCIAFSFCLLFQLLIFQFVGIILEFMIFVKWLPGHPLFTSSFLSNSVSLEVPATQNPVCKTRQYAGSSVVSNSSKYSLKPSQPLICIVKELFQPKYYNWEHSVIITRMVNSNFWKVRRLLGAELKQSVCFKKIPPQITYKIVQHGS